ncbi:hypothetical protein [Agromyces binzhouensis]|uniref:hypothetical protein n=1 Tax=Agromyces binzhouensis TaxID=1817495 RepID=UPI003640C92A
MSGYTSPSDCEICIELGGGVQPEYYAVWGVPDTGRVLRRNSRLALVPDLAPLHPNHCLLFATSHFLSFADFLSEDRDARTAEVIEFIEEYRSQFGTVTLIEHGSTASLERDPSCVTHAHIHLFSVDAAAVLDIFRAEAGIRVSSPLGLREVTDHAFGREYVMVGNLESMQLAIDWAPPHRQYARSLVGRATGLSLDSTWSDKCLNPSIVRASLADWGAADDR